MNKMIKRVIMTGVSVCFACGLLLIVGDATIQNSLGDQDTVSMGEVVSINEIVLPSKFSLVDEGYATAIKSQESGTCWAVAASISMESNYKYVKGADIEIDPNAIVETVFVDDATEGMMLEVYNDKYDFGGDNLEVVEYLSNGFGDYYLEDAVFLTDYDRDTIKRQIMTLGGMYVAYNDAWNSRYGVFEGYKTLNNPVADPDHASTILGWDDDFPKEYFKLPPKENGAWIVQNTRGDKWGTGGYFWISYETPLFEETIFQMSDDYTEVQYYDIGHYNTLETDETITLANVFHCPGTLKRVGTYTEEPNQKLVIEIYDAELSNVVYTEEVTFEIPGYHTIALAEPQEVSDYAIAITYYGNAAVEGLTWIDDEWGISYIAESHAGESFALLDGEWIDMTDEIVQEKFGIDYAPNNCCIKAIY